MAKLVEMLNKPIANVIELQDEIALLNRWGFLSKTQAATIKTEITPAIPCTLIIHMRTRKGLANIVAVSEIGARSFAVNPRAQVM